MSTISFILYFLFKLIERLGRILVLTLFCLCQQPILHFLLETEVGFTLIFVRFVPKNVVPKLWNAETFWFWLNDSNLFMNLTKATLNSFFSFLISSFTVLKKLSNISETCSVKLSLLAPSVLLSNSLILLSASLFLWILMNLLGQFPLHMSLRCCFFFSNVEVHRKNVLNFSRVQSWQIFLARKYQILGGNGMMIQTL